MILVESAWFGGYRGRIIGVFREVFFEAPAIQCREKLGTVRGDLYLYPCKESIPSQTFRLLFDLGLVEYRLGDRNNGQPPRWRWKGPVPQAYGGAA